MSTKANSSVPSATEQILLDEHSDDSSSDEEWSSKDVDTDDETVEVNGFNVLVSQEEEVSEMFEKHGDLVSNLSIKNQQLKDAYMDVLLGLIKRLSKPIDNLSLEVLNKADNTLFDLTRAGFKLGWLCQKLDEAYLKKEKQRVGRARIKELEEHAMKQKLALDDLQSDIEKEKDAVLAAEAGLDFSDMV